MSSYNSEGANLRNDNGEGPHSIYEKMRSILETVDCTYKFVKFADDIKQKKWKLDLTVFPEFAYLSWNASLEGITKAAAIILSNSIEAEVAEAEIVSKELSIRAQEKINQSLEGLGIHNEVPSIQGISATVSFELKNQLKDFFVRKQNAEDLVHIDNQGEGIKRQIWFALLKLQAEQEATETNNKRYIWCFDEPETHLHPKAQREFIKTLRALSAQNFQVVVCTHSTVFVDASQLDEINSFMISNSYTTIGRSQSVEDIHNSLGVMNSDFLFYNKFLIVEGNTEESLIPHLYQKYTGKTLRQENIQLINLRGCNNADNANYILESLIDGFAKREDIAVYIFDADTNKDATGSTFIVGKQDLEDSLPINIWPRMVEQCFEGAISISEEDITNILSEIPATSVNSQVRANDKFAPKLQSLIYQKLQGIGEPTKISNWPNKSSEWGEKLGEHMAVNDIPQPIIQAFNALG
jgi:predicted ATP-dependent endonuclease of OLD family